MPFGRTIRLMTTICLGIVQTSVVAQVRINELMARGSDRLLKWNDLDVPKLGYGLSWYESSFNDTSWLSGNGPFGFGTFTNVTPTPTIGTNVGTQMINLTPTVYLRKTFTVSPAEAASTEILRLEVKFNDGFVCYLNGVEVARRNAGAPNEFKYRDSFAAMGTPAHTESTTTPYLRTETISLGETNTKLVAGTNIIAVQALNFWESTTLHNTTNNSLVGINNIDNFYFGGDLKMGTNTVFVAANTPWKFFPGVAEPSGCLYDPSIVFAVKQNVPWGRQAFDDSLWSSGATPFGAGTPPGGVVLGTNLTSQIPGKAASLYCRIVFTATTTDLADPLPMQLLMDWDDGFVAYINGVEVARDRMDAANSFTPHDAVASSVRNGGGYTTYNLDPPASLVQAGQNVLAVQVHNVALADSDLFMRAQLRTNSAGTNRLIVTPTSTWKYFVGVSEPVQSQDDQTDDDVDDFEYSPDWVELANPGTSDIPLAGWKLSDDSDEPAKWSFPPGALIPAGGHLVVMCDDLDITAPASGGYYHTNFKLSSTGDSVVLTDSNGTLVDNITFGEQTSFESYGRDGSGQWVYQGDPSPGSTNTGSSFPGQVAKVQFSLTPGFYPSSRNLVLSTATPGAMIRFTTDGTEPTPLTGLISTNVSLFTTISVRARAFKAGMIPSETTTGTFLIAEPTSRQSVAAVCLVGDPQRSLYRPFGIMAIADGSWSNFSAPAPTGNNGVWTQTGPLPGNPADLAAFNNPIHRGRFVERPVNMEVYRSDGSPGPNVSFGMRMAGSPHARPRYRLTNQNRLPDASPGPNEVIWSQTDFTQKPSFNFYFRGDYSDDLEWPLFPDYPTTTFHSLRVRAGKNDVFNPFIEDEYMRRLFINTGQVGSRGMINTLYVNGVYKGFYNVCEHLRQNFFRIHYNSDKDWDVRQVTTIASGDGLAFQEMITYLRNNPQSVLANYQGMKQRLDMVNFIDYLLTNIVGNTGDWPHNNFICSRERSEEGRHRYHPWDAEGAFGDFGGTVRTNMFVAGTSGSIVTTAPASAGLGEGIRILYTLLRASPEFKLLFADRIQKHFFNGGCFTEAKMLAEWNAMKAEFAPLIAPTPVLDRVTPWFNGVGNTTRYTTGSTTNTPSRRVVLFDGYFDATNGGSFVQPQFTAEGLWPATKAPVFSHAAGNIQAGTLVTISNPNASGTIYFTQDGRDPRAEGGAALGTPYTSALPIHYSLTIKARILSSGGEWSPLVEVAFDAQRQAIHSWTFEHVSNYLSPTETYGGGRIVIESGASTQTERSNASQEFETAHLRVNDPLGSTIVISLPTNGFEHLSLEYQTRRSGQGASVQTVEYTTNGTTWNHLESYNVLDDEPQPRWWRLDQAPLVNNNPQFAVRITFTQGSGGVAGNNRFDDIRLSGVPITGYNFSPIVTPGVPERFDVIEVAAAQAHPVTSWITDPNLEPLVFSAVSSQPQIASVNILGNAQMELHPVQRGESIITLSASDGVNPPVQVPIRVLVHPKAHSLANGPFVFSEWARDNIAHTYPRGVLFLQGTESDSSLNTVFDRAYNIPLADAAAPTDPDQPYRATSRTRINGLGIGGVAFINTGRGRDLGGAVIALNTLGLGEAKLRFTAGTVLANSRVYAIRLQYRLGITGTFTDFPGPVEYVRSSSDGHSVSFGPLALPAALLNRPYVQLMWRYYQISGSGARPQLRLDDILVSTGPDVPVNYDQWTILNFSSQEDRNNPEISGPEAELAHDGVSNLFRYATGVGPTDDLRMVTPVLVQAPGGGYVYRFKYNALPADITWRVCATNVLGTWPFTLFDSTVDAIPPLQDGWLDVEVPASLAGSSTPDRRVLLQLQIERLP